MPDSIVCPPARRRGSLSSEPGLIRYLRVPGKKNSAPSPEINLPNFHDRVPKLSKVQRVGVAPRADRVGLPENAPKAVGVDCGARFLKTHPVTNPVVDPSSHGCY